MLPVPVGPMTRAARMRALGAAPSSVRCAAISPAIEVPCLFNPGRRHQGTLEMMEHDAAGTSVDIHWNL